MSRRIWAQSAASDLEEAIDECAVVPPMSVTRGTVGSVMLHPRPRLLAVTALALVLTGACSKSMPSRPTQPPIPTVIASAYILPGAVSLNDHAFGDEPVVIYSHERLRWVNAVGVTHRIVAATPDATNIRITSDQSPGGQQSIDMARRGRTRIHCPIQPNMTGTLVVREH